MAKSILSVVRCVLYLRMSSAEQDLSIDQQRTELRKFAERLGYKIVDEYLDPAISGDRTEQRTGFLKMRDAAGSGKFDVILAWDQDRFGRFDPLDAGYWIYPFRQAGVRLETIAQGPIDWEDLTGQLVYSVNQLGKAQFLRDLSRNTTRGLLAAAREGTAGTGGPNPLGYRSRDGEVWIVPDEAKIVRLIFRLYLKPGGSIRSVAAELNRRKIPTPGQSRGLPRAGKVWRGSAVRTILERRKYTGTFVYGNRNGGRYFAMRDGEIVPRRKTDKFVSSTPIIHQDRFEAIVDQETFDAVQRKLKTGKAQTSTNKSHPYLLAGLVRCGDCKGSMGGFRPAKPKYRCRLYHQTGRSSCYNNTIEEGPLVNCVSRKIQEKWLSEAGLARLRRDLETEQGRTQPRPRDLAKLRREIEALDRKIDNAETAVLDAPANSRAGLYRKLEEFNTDRDRLKSDLQSLTAHQGNGRKSDGSEIDQAIDALRKLRETLRKAKPEEAKGLLSSIVTKIELHFDHGETAARRNTSSFSHGFIHVRPDAGEARSADPKSTQLTNKGPVLTQD